MDAKSHDLIRLNCLQFISTLIYIHKLKGSWHCMWDKGAAINISLTSGLPWKKRQKAKLWSMHIHWAEGLAHDSKMMYFCFYPSTIFIYKQRANSSFSSGSLILWSGLIAFIQSVGPLQRAGKNKEGWGSASALKELSIAWGGKMHSPEPLISHCQVSWFSKRQRYLWIGRVRKGFREEGLRWV